MCIDDRTEVERLFHSIGPTVQVLRPRKHDYQTLDLCELR